MYSVSDEYKALSTAAVRKHNIDLTFYHLVNGVYEKYAAYYEREDSPIISLKIINGQTTGGFSIGGTYCSTLEITAHINVTFQVNDKVIAQTEFRTMDEDSGSEWLLQGVYFIDTITANQFNVKVTALDAMARLAKDYNSALAYPATVESMLSEISSQSGVGLSDIDIFNNASIAAKPVKATDDQGNQLYYTRREVLGYLAGINGGNAYIDNNGLIAFSTPRETGYRIKSESVISQTFSGAELTIDNVVLNKSGKSGSTADGWDENAVQLYAPLDVGEDVVAPITQKLSGTHYEAITLKKQGTGMFEPGDLVTYTALDGSYHDMLIMGVAYELADGFFSETLYSLAQSSAQRQYSGTQNISQNIAPSASGGGAGTRVVSYEYLSDTSAKFNGITYTVEKNEKGLITKISDDTGNSLKPTISGEITDIPLHNAVFWAVTMHGGFGGFSARKIFTSGEGLASDYLWTQRTQSNNDADMPKVYADRIYLPDWSNKCILLYTDTPTKPKTFCVELETSIANPNDQYKYWSHMKLGTGYNLSALNYMGTSGLAGQYKRMNFISGDKDPKDKKVPRQTFRFDIPAEAWGKPLCIIFFTYNCTMNVYNIWTEA